VGQGMLALFQLATLEGWTDQMWAIVDCRGIDMQPMRDSNVSWVYFWLTFIVVGAFLAVNLFVGAVCDSFMENSLDDGETGFMTPEQREWSKTKRLILRLHLTEKAARPAEDSSTLFRRIVFDICEHPYFTSFNLALILLQCLVLASTSLGQSDQITLGLEVANAVIAGFFLLEVVMKVVAYGVKPYFRQNSNCFDCAVALLAIAGTIDVFLVHSPLGIAGKVVRVFRSFRLLHLLSSTLRGLVVTIYVSMPAIANVSILFGLGECMWWVI
jgi:hypothetical protein